MAHPEVVAEPDTENLYEYLTFQFILGEGTMFRNICKVQPGHYMNIDMESWKINEVKYWIPNFKIDQYHTEEYFIVELQKILDETISQQLRSDVPVGTYLSGGLDSSLVTIMASKFLGKSFKSFSGAFNEGPEFNELEYARIAAKAANAELFEVFPTEQEFIDLLPKLIYHLDEPVAGPGIVSPIYCFKARFKTCKSYFGRPGRR